MFGLGAPELLIVLGLVVLLFGASRVPQLARSLGQAKKEFEAGSREGGAADEPEPKRGKGRAEKARPVEDA